MITGENEAEKINNLREIFPPAYRVIQLEKFLIKNITASYDKLKLLIKDTIANEKVTKRKIKPIINRIRIFLKKLNLQVHHSLRI